MLLNNNLKLNNLLKIKNSILKYSRFLSMAQPTEIKIPTPWGYIADFHGMFAPVFTPIKDNSEEINYKIIPTYAEYLRKHNVSGIYLGGTTGEGLLLTVEERELLLEKWMHAVNVYPLKVIAMIGAASIFDVKRLARHAEGLGVDGIAVLPSIFYKPKTARDLVDYCKEVSISCPKTQIFYYHIPSMTNVEISMVEFLATGKQEIPNLRGIKFTDIDVAGEGLKCLCHSERFDILTGLDQKLTESLKLGYVGAINCSFNFVPNLTNEIFQIMTSKDKKNIEKALKCQEKLDGILDVIFSYTNGFTVSCVKAAMNILTDINVGPPRKPLKELSSEQKSDMKLKLAKLLKE